jgi:hypothetical protein
MGAEALAPGAAVLNDRALLAAVPGETEPLRAAPRLVAAPSTDGDHPVASLIEALLVAARVLGERAGLLDSEAAPLRRRLERAIGHIAAAVEGVEWQAAMAAAAQTVADHPFDFGKAMVEGFWEHSKGLVTGLWELLEQIGTGFATANAWCDQQLASFVDAALHPDAPPSLVELQASLRKTRAAASAATKLTLDTPLVGELASEAYTCVREVILELVEHLDPTARRQLAASVHAAALSPEQLGNATGVVLSEVAVLIVTEGTAPAAREARALADSTSALKPTGIVDLIVEAFRRAGRRIGGRINAERVKIARKALDDVQAADVARGQRLLGTLFKAQFDEQHLRYGSYRELVSAKAPANRSGFLMGLLDAARDAPGAFSIADEEVHSAALADKILEANHVIPDHDGVINAFPEIASKLGEGSRDARTAINLTRGQHTAAYARHLERWGLPPTDVKMIVGDEVTNLTTKMKATIRPDPKDLGLGKAADGKFYFAPGKTPLKTLIIYLRDDIYSEDEVRKALAPLFATWLAKLK